MIWCEHTKQAAFIDPGGEPEKLLHALDSEDLQLRMILLTHGHLDHVGAATTLAQRKRVPIVGPHEADQFWLQTLPEQAEMFGFPHASRFVPDRWIGDGEQISIGDVALTTLHCPGHTPGHIVLVDKTDKLAFVGDVLFKGGIGRTDFPKGDHRALLASIHNKLLPIGDDTRFVPGHGPMSTFGEERRTNPFLRNTNSDGT